MALLCGACGGLDAPSEQPSESRPDELEIDFTRLGLIDCSERMDTGYVSGNPFPITVVTVDGKPVERETANAYWVMQQAAAVDGVQIAIVSGFRTQAEQQYLYDCYINCNCNNCNLAAVPGYSNHQSGHALDLNTSSPGVLSWLNANGGEFGFSRTVPSEDWHWEWWGGGPGGGPCGGCTPSCDGTVITASDCSTEDCADGGQTCVDDSFGVRCEPVCEPLSVEGGVLEEAGSCFSAFGPNRFWRSVEGEGHGGALLWTNAFESDSPSNWARWNLNLSSGGEYDVEIYLEPAYAIYAETRYEIRHDGEESSIIVDQSASSGWTPLGRFAFAPGEDQWVAVYDDTGPVAADQHIAVDALRLTPFSDTTDPIDPAVGERPTIDDKRAIPASARELLPGRSLDGPPETREPPARETVPGRTDIGGGCNCRSEAGPAPTLPGRMIWVLAAFTILRGKRRRSRRREDAGPETVSTR